MTWPRELRDGEAVARWLAIGLAVRRAPVGDAAAHADDELATTILACAHELPALPPPGVIADLASVLAGAPLAPRGPLAGALHAAVRAYDDDVLARLGQLARFTDLVAAFAHAAPGDRGAAVALVVAAVCERAGFAGTIVSPAALRRALGRPCGERDAAGRAALAGEGGHAPDDAAAISDLADAYHRLARGARQSRALIDDHVVFAVDHLGVLRDLGGRMTAAHLAAAAAELAARLPRRLPVGRDVRGAHDTQLADDSLFPAGGFTSITAGGELTANLVTSELMYMDDGAPGAPAEIDVFALRYAAGDLLHYTRDDSVFRRHRHVIGFALAADLAAARIKDRDLPWQRLILVLGVVLAAVRWLADQLAGELGEQALAVRIAFPPAGLGLGEERHIVAVLLAAEIARGTVVIVDEPCEATAAVIAAASASAIADLVIISRGEPPPLPRGVRALHIDVAAPTPMVRSIAPPGPAEDRDCPDLGSDPWRRWGDAAEDLLRWLV